MENEKRVSNYGDVPPKYLNKWKIDYKKCTLCGECVEACSLGLLEIKNEKIIINEEERCIQCGDCTAVCDYYAIAFA